MCERIYDLGVMKEEEGKFVDLPGKRPTYLILLPKKFWAVKSFGKYCMRNGSEMEIRWV